VPGAEGSRPTQASSIIFFRWVTSGEGLPEVPAAACTPALCGREACSGYLPALLPWRRATSTLRSQLMPALQGGVGAFRLS